VNLLILNGRPGPLSLPYLPAKNRFYHGFRCVEHLPGCASLPFERERLYDYCQHKLEGQ
jgi:hypothetical protein